MNMFAEFCVGYGGCSLATYMQLQQRESDSDVRHLISDLRGVCYRAYETLSCSTIINTANAKYPITTSSLVRGLTRHDKLILAVQGIHCCYGHILHKGQPKDSLLCCFAI
jgi:hypothetical protein